jgi:hypothetical protein
MNANTESDFWTHRIATANSTPSPSRRIRNAAWTYGPVFALSLASLLPGAAIAQTTDAVAEDDSKREEIIVTGVPPAENIMPTQHSSSSIYGLDLNVMDTPRNTTMLSKEQLQAINIEDPRSFSYLTSSSYTDSAFGGPNTPRIRGQYGDIFYNGMRSSFTVTGYGAPLSFNSIETINITKGPASVIAGPGPGVGGSADFITKRPSLTTESGQASFEFDTLDVHRWNLDYSSPVIPGELAYRFSYSGEDNGSHFYTHYLDQQALYGAVTWSPNDAYTFDFNTEGVISNYEENVGVNRVNQNLIDNGTYLTGQPIQGLQTTGPFDGMSAYKYVFGTAPPYAVGSHGNPFSPVYGILTEYVLGKGVHLNPQITLDETPGTSAHAFVYNAQFIQKYQFNDDVGIENNTFFDYENRDNQAIYYFSDSAKDTYTLESKTQLHLKYEAPISSDGAYNFNNDVIVGGTVRYAHVNVITNFSNEPAGVYDLTTNPNLWFFSPSAQSSGDALPYTSADGRIQYGVPGRDAVNQGSTGISDLTDLGVFFEDRISFTDQLSLMLGGREDFVQNDATDPLGPEILNGLAKSHSTAWFGLGNFNISPVYQFSNWGSAYLTYDYAQNVSGAGSDGGIGTFGFIPDKKILQQTSRLYEAGLKFNLLNNTLFIGTAVFDQERMIPNGLAGDSASQARTNGAEIEINYQPERHFFMTASYSYVRTRLSQPFGFYNYPAQPGLNVDGAGLFAVFLPGQHFQDPGIPEHVFNFLGSYRFDSGFGFTFGAQVTGPFYTSQSGYLDPVNSLFVPASVQKAGYYFQSPRVPWQYTLNAAVYYDTGPYEFKFSIYNLTDQNNWEGSNPLYGNDFLVHSNPIDFDFTMKVKF